MSESELSVREAHAGQMVPAGFAEKAMASLMQLHTELSEEKERRVDLYRRLMEREQAVAELKMYVKVLEEKLKPQVPEPPEEVARVVRPTPVAPPLPKPMPPPIPIRSALMPKMREAPRPPPPPTPTEPRLVQKTVVTKSQTARQGPRAARRASGDGWRSW